MGNENLAFKYSNDIYATRKQVSQMLGISNIDKFWNDIISYRSHYTLSLNLRNIERMPINLVLSPKILDDLVAKERRLSKLMVKFGKLNDDDYVKYAVRNNQYNLILTNIAQKYHIDFSEGLLNLIIGGNASSLTPSQNILLNYFQALHHIETRFYDPIDEKLLRTLLGYLLPSNDENIYRKEEIEDSSSRIIIDRIYSAAPVERIVPMMNDLFDFLNNNNNCPALAKAIVAFYYVMMIKPFDFFSEEMATLLAKYVLAHNDFEEPSVLIDFECFINDYQEDVNYVMKEVNKTNDVTYLLTFMLDKITEHIDNMSSSIEVSNSKSIEKEFFKNELDKSEPKEKNEKKHVEVVESQEDLLHNVDYEVRVALPKLPIGLDERNANAIAEHLLEMKPNLKRGEAQFYARHCTIGKYYTIQQYKEMNECAYETARTSMDNLVSEGFYQKEMIKNKKYVYTPIPRK